MLELVEGSNEAVISLIPRVVTASIYGTVIDSNEEPANVTVTVKSYADEGTWTVNTDEQGYYSLSGITPGDVSIAFIGRRITPADYEGRKFVTTLASGESRGIDMTLVIPDGIGITRCDIPRRVGIGQTVPFGMLLQNHNQSSTSSRVINCYIDGAFHASISVNLIARAWTSSKYFTYTPTVLGERLVKIDGFEGILIVQ